MTFSRLLALGYVLGMACQASPTFAAVASVGEPAPPWQLSDLSGRPVRLAELAGRVVLINFFKTSCVPCLWEIPDFSELQEQYGSDGLTVVGIAAQETTEILQPFAEAQSIDYSLFPSTDAVLWDYNVLPLGGIPLTVVIDRAGVVADWYRYYQTKVFHESKILPLLAAELGPTLAIARVDNTLKISWPAADENFLLESLPRLDSALSWQTVTNEVQVLGERRLINWPVAGGSAFFRLRKL
jgi:peroxiredoxin